MLHEWRWTTDVPLSSVSESGRLLCGEELLQVGNYRARAFSNLVMIIVGGSKSIGRHCSCVQSTKKPTEFEKVSRAKRIIPSKPMTFSCLDSLSRNRAAVASFKGTNAYSPPNFPACKLFPDSAVQCRTRSWLCADLVVVDSRFQMMIKVLPNSKGLMQTKCRPLMRAKRRSYADASASAFYE
jgi:hypothetical protein